MQRRTVAAGVALMTALPTGLLVASPTAGADDVTPGPLVQVCTSSTSLLGVVTVGECKEQLASVSTDGASVKVPVRVKGSTVLEPSIGVTLPRGRTPVVSVGTSPAKSRTQSNPIQNHTPAASATSKTPAKGSERTSVTVVSGGTSASSRTAAAPVVKATTAPRNSATTGSGTARSSAVSGHSTTAAAVPGKAASPAAQAYEPRSSSALSNSLLNGNLGFNATNIILLLLFIAATAFAAAVLRLGARRRTPLVRHIPQHRAA